MARGVPRAGNHAGGAGVQFCRRRVARFARSAPAPIIRRQFLHMNVYTQFGLEPIINAAGASTRVGGPLMHPAAAKAMLEAAGSCIGLDQLQGAASRIIAEATGAEAGYVTAGASSM